MDELSIAERSGATGNCWSASGGERATTIALDQWAREKASEGRNTSEARCICKGVDRRSLFQTVASASSSVRARKLFWYGG